MLDLQYCHTCLQVVHICRLTWICVVPGLNDADEVGTWRYTNGESLTYANWPGGAPRAKRTVHRKNCVLVDKKRKFRNKICSSRKARLICEQDIGADDPDRSPPKRDISSKSRSGKKKRIRLKNRQSDGRSRKNSYERTFFSGKSRKRRDLEFDGFD